MLYVSETWRMNDKEVAILRRTEKALLRAKRRVRLKNRKNTSELITMLGLTASMEMAVETDK